MGTVTVEIEDELLAALGKTAEERKTFVLEAVAIEAVRTGKLYKPQARRIVGLERAEFLRLLWERKVPEDIDDEAIIEGYKAIKRIFPE
jgi:predicted HTH domain antitoxin